MTNKTAHNERLKLRASALDRLSTVVLSTAFIVPFINLTMDAGGSVPHRELSLNTLLIAFTWILPSALLHLGAAEFLKGLKE